ncbi:DinB family protein [Kutzneria viridogrisea]|uniref:DinB family protein n=2 Tax=Kutzneria TaxID=43356 RepID=W5WNJ5_9PSEU|nr:DinB family protein [Kutzneria albida]AHH99724.1 hypothetical protein KALB_6364 [Kutzneria albida DSM 43870]MBA8924901.1 putative damage-inducible protein DinB [Kutzneria viridogrisea]
MSTEHDEILAMLANQRDSLLITVRGLSDEDARKRTTVSELTLGGLVKHVTACQAFWTRVFVEADGVLPEGMINSDQYRMTEEETLAGLVADYAAAFEATERAVAGQADLGREVPLPVFPWGPQETQYWSVRRILLHLLRETAHHCGHADIIRESLDGANTTAQWA